MKDLRIDNVNPARLKPNPWNTNHVSPENEQKLEASLKRFGFTRPIIVRETSDGLQIIGGEHRWQVAQKMGYETVPVVNLGALDDKRAKEIGLIDNGRYGEDDTLRLGELFKELGTPSELLSFLPYTDTEFDQIFKASDIALDDLDVMNDDGELPDLSSAVGKTQDFQIMRFKIPMGDVAKVQQMIELTMKNQNLTSEDSLSNAGAALVHLLLSKVK